ncbi:MAG TPA: hypothetical protein VG455_04795, partial [Acidimicrobiales bacterium]|nr:hypothetical protein [Acidimicrobiales bacterium]
TWRRAHHVSAAVAYATWQYWQVTGDDDFFATAGAEMLVETARFWASRIDHDEGGRGHITDIMGPDEYHEHVDDSAYTNWMAAHTLDVGRRTAVWLQRERPDDWRAVQASTGLTSDEVDGWADVAAGVVRGQHPATGLIEEFAGYFTLEDVNPREFGDGDRSLQRALGREGVANTQIVKQADVVLLCHVLADKVGPDAVASNFDYYGPRCDHASSLSRSVHAAVAARLGREDVALDLLHAAASLERGDDIGKAEHGVHIANEGGLWQAVVGGVAGLEVTASNLSITPRLLPGWERVRVPFEWRRRRFVAEVRRAGAGNTDVAVWVGAEGAPLARQQLAAGERLALRAEA